jgi:hypothetical protein
VKLPITNLWKGFAPFKVDVENGEIDIRAANNYGRKRLGRLMSCPLRASPHTSMCSSRFKWNLQPNCLAQLLAEKRTAGAEILDLTESNPTRVGFENHSQEILDALKRPEALLYEPSARGLIVARKAISGYYEGRVDPQHIFLTASTSESYSFLFKLLTDRGDNLLFHSRAILSSNSSPVSKELSLYHTASTTRRGVLTSIP